MKTYLIGMDGGGTKTACRLAETSRVNVAEFNSGAANYKTVGLGGAAKVLHTLIGQATAAMEPGGRVAAACLGLSDIDDLVDRERLFPIAAEVFRSYGQTPQLLLVNDADIALAGAFGRGEGILVNAGTGVIILGRNGAGKRVRANCWGPFLGDLGSGYYLGHEALIAVIEELDGRGAITGLTPAIMSHYRAYGPDDLVRAVQQLTVAQVADWARLVMELAADGDQLCRDLLVQAARLLIESTLAVAERLGVLTTGSDIAMSGSVARNKLVSETYAAELAAAWPGGRLVETQASPVEGAILLADLASQGRNYDMNTGAEAWPRVRSSREGIDRDRGT